MGIGHQSGMSNTNIPIYEMYRSRSSTSSRSPTSFYQPSTYDISFVYAIPWPYNSLVPWSYTPCGCANICNTRKARVGSSYIPYNDVKYTSTMAGLLFRTWAAAVPRGPGLLALQLSVVSSCSTNPLDDTHYL